MTLHRLLNWAIAAAAAVLMGLTWHLDDHAADMTRTDAERAAQTAARLQKAAQDLCLAEAGPGAAAIWTTDGALVCRPRRNITITKNGA